MSPIDATIIRRKLQRIMTSLDGLRPIARLSLEEYRARFYERKATERLLQEAIEAALDVNAHLIAELGGEVPEEYYGGVRVLLRLYPRYIQAVESPLTKAGL